MRIIGLTWTGAGERGARRAGIVLAALAVLAPAQARASDTAIVSQVGTAGAVANDQVTEVAVAAGGHYVAFVSSATNLGGPTDGSSAVYLKDTQTGDLTLVSRATGAAGAIADGSSTDVSITSDGRYVAFASTASNLGAGGGATGHVYVRDTQLNTTTAVDRATGTGAALGGGDPVISADGSTVAFEGLEDSYSGGTTGIFQVYARTLATNTTELVSRASGASGAAADFDAGTGGTGPPIAISSDGRYVAFVSTADNLTAEGNPGGSNQIFLRDRTSGTTSLISQATTGGPPGDADSEDPSVSTSGSVAFSSNADNLGSALGGTFVRPLGGPTVVVSRAPGLAGAAQGSFGPVALSRDGATVVWVAGDTLAGNAPPGVLTGGVIERRVIADGSQTVADVNARGAPLSQSFGPVAVSGDGSQIAFVTDASPIDPSAGHSPQAILRTTSGPAPAASSAPSIAGTPSSGGPLVCESGDWTGLPTQFTYRWLRDGTQIATGARYVVTDGDVGHNLTCEVTATNGHPTAATSAPVAVPANVPVQSGAFEYLGTFGSAAQFSTEVDGIAVAPDGDVAVADRGTGGSSSLGLYAPDGTFVRALAPAGLDPGSIGSPDGVAVSADGAIVTRSAARNQLFTQDGYALGEAQCGSLSATSVAVDAGGQIYVGGRGGSGPVVAVCDPAGNLLRTLTVPTSAPSVSGLAVGPDGLLYILAGATVVVLDTNGALQRTFPVADQFSIAVGPNGHVWVGGAKVTEYSPTGAQLAEFGTTGSAAGEFETANALAIGGDGSVWVLDSGDERIEHFREVQGSGGVVNIDTTPPTLTLVSAPTRALLKAGNPALGLRCSEQCSVSVTGEFKIIKRTVTTTRAHVASAAKRHPRRHHEKHKQAGKPLPKLPPLKPPTKTVTLAVTAAGDLGAVTASLAPNAVTPVGLTLPGSEPAAFVKAAAQGTIARFSLHLTATDPAGNPTNASIDLRVVLR